MKFITLIFLLFSSTISLAQNKIQWNGKAGIGLTNGSRTYAYDWYNGSGEFSALSSNVGLSASYKFVELEVGYLRPFSIIGINHRISSFNSTAGNLILAPVYSNLLNSYQNLHAILNVKLNIGKFHFKIDWGLAYNDAQEISRTIYSIDAKGIFRERVEDLNLSIQHFQPLVKISNIIGPYEISYTRFNQKSIYDKERNINYQIGNIAISRYLVNEMKHENWDIVKPERKRIISFTPGYKFYLPIGNGLASGRSLFFEITKPIQTNWEITASVQGAIDFYGFTKTKTFFRVEQNAIFPFGEDNRLEDYTFYKLLVSRIKKLTPNHSFVYGLGPTVNYKKLNGEESIIGVTAHASFYSPSIQYRLEFNVPMGDLPSYLSIGIGAPITIFKKLNKVDSQEIDLDNWNL